MAAFERPARKESLYATSINDDDRIVLFKVMKGKGINEGCIE